MILSGILTNRLDVRLKVVNFRVESECRSACRFGVRAEMATERWSRYQGVVFGEKLLWKIRIPATFLALSYSNLGLIRRE